VEEFSRYSGHMFLSRDCIETLHEVLDIQVSCIPLVMETLSSFCGMVSKGVWPNPHLIYV
jgi:hypothetical protein